MSISHTAIQKLLNTEDIEGLVELGAPEDEYAAEAKEIVVAVHKLGKEQMTEANIVAIIALVWAKSFNLSEQDIKKRLSAFKRVAGHMQNRLRNSGNMG